MSIFSHNIYENIRTRTIVLSEGHILLHSPEHEVLHAGEVSSDGWTLPGGGLEPHESLAECARREVFEETGIEVVVGRIAFLREWVVPRYTSVPSLARGTPPEEAVDGHGFGLEVFHFAAPLAPLPKLRPESPDVPAPQWVALEKVPSLPIWPKQLKWLCRRLIVESPPIGIHSFVSDFESPWADLLVDPFQDA